MSIERKHFVFCDEFYVVEKSVELVVTLADGPKRIKIDALRDHSGKYSTKAYAEEDVKIELAFPQAGISGRQVRHWIDYELPWTDRSSADDAIAQALGFLEERVR